MPELCRTCRRRLYCRALNFHMLKDPAFVEDFFECRLYSREEEFIRDENQFRPESRFLNVGNACDLGEFNLEVKLTIRGKVKEFQINDGRSKQYSELKRLCILIDREKLQRDLSQIISRELMRALGKRGRDCTTRQDARCTIEVPLIYSQWILN